MMNTNNKRSINSLFSRMISNDKASASEKENSSSSSNEVNSTKRNLFGIRLNHDQLKQDLKEMWKEQCEMQKYRWNFDFEKMKPVKPIGSSSNDSTLTEETSSMPSTSSRFQWHRININYKPGLVDQNELQMTAFKKDEIKYFNNNNLFNDDSQCLESTEEDDIETEEEEEDLALAIPQFYKYQRRIKLNEDKNRQKFNFAQSTTNQSKRTIVSATPIKKPIAKKTSPTLFESASTFKPIFKIQTTTTTTTTTTASKSTSISPQEKVKVVTRSSAKKTNSKSSNEVIAKPRPIKQQKIESKSTATIKKTNKTKKAITKNNKITKSKIIETEQTPVLKLTPSVKNLIITFSENRKDTLRSATTNQTTTTTTNEMQSTTRNAIIQSESSAFVSVHNTQQQQIIDVEKTPNLKQQSLLDLFKQRKRRNSTSNAMLNSVAAMIKQSQTQSAVSNRINNNTHYLRSQVTHNF